MTYEVLRGFTANGRIYRSGDRIEGAELKHEASMATRRLIKLVSQAEGQGPNPLPGDVHVPRPAAAPLDRSRGRS